MRLWLLIFALPALAATGRVVTHPKPPFGITSIAEAGDGLYLGSSESGLHRFDGFRHREVAGYPFRRADAVAVTNDGLLWVGSEEEGLLRRGPRGEWVVVSREPARMGVAMGRYLFVQDIRTRHLRRLDATGAVKTLPLPGECGMEKSPAQELWLTCGTAVYRLTPEEMALGLPLPVSNALPDAQGRVWMLDSRGGVATAWKNGKRVAEVRGLDQARGMVLGEGGQVWLWTRTTLRGLSPSREFAATVTTAFRDRRGHLWLGSQELQEVIPDEGWEEWRLPEFGGSTPVQVLRNARQELILVTEGRLYRLDEGARRWVALSEESRQYAYAFSLPDGEMLASVRDYGVVRMTAEGRHRLRLPPSEEIRIRDEFRTIAQADGRIWVGNKKGLFQALGDALKLVRLPGVKDWEERVDGQKLQDANPVDFVRDPQGRLWLGYTAGLARLEADGAWRQVPTEPALADVRSFAFRGVGEIWVAHRNKPYFSRVRGGKAQRFAVEEGYSPEQTYFLKTDRRGWVWRGTSRGIYVSDGEATGPEDWLFLDTGDECLQYGFFEDADGSVWVAGLEKVLHLRPSPGWFRAVPGEPVLSRATVGGRPVRELPAAAERSTGWALEFLKGGGGWTQPLRYRVMPLFADWRVAREGRVEVPDLANGAYALEVRQLGRAGVWRHSFRVGAASGWRWGWALLPMAILGAMWGAYRWRARLEYRWRKMWFLVRRWRNGAAPRGLSDLTGTRLADRYRLERRLSPGGFSQVYAAFDEREGRPVAIKVMEQRSGDGAWVRARFAQELTALRAVSHPGVVALLDSWIQPTGELCLVTPLIAGQTLRAALVAGEPWEPARVATLVRSLGDALTAIHEAGIVHRDVKPENILLREDGSPVLIDFGTSGLLGSQEEPAVTKVLTGTIEYLAPERLTGHYSAGSDLYSFAVVVFEMLTGKKLADAGLVVSAERLKERLNLTRGGAEVSLVLAKALQPKPEDRPGEARAWANRLAELLEASGRG